MWSRVVSDRWADGAILIKAPLKCADLRSESVVYSPYIYHNFLVSDWVIKTWVLIVLIMEAASTSETSVKFYQTTRRKNPEDNHHHTEVRLSDTIVL
jgi:hypothetical protein